MIHLPVDQIDRRKFPSWNRLPQSACCRISRSKIRTCVELIQEPENGGRECLSNIEGWNCVRVKVQLWHVWGTLRERVIFNIWYICYIGTLNRADIMHEMLQSGIPSKREQFPNQSTLPKLPHFNAINAWLLNTHTLAITSVQCVWYNVIFTFYKRHTINIILKHSLPFPACPPWLEIQTNLFEKSLRKNTCRQHGPSWQRISQLTCVVSQVKH